jgi:CBS domain-containing protein/ribosome-associated translation inhibitor RaiA
MKVGEIMSKKVYLLEPENTVMDFISLMEREHVHEAPIVKDKKVVGFVHYKELARYNIDPETTKLETIMMSPPKVRMNDDVLKAIELIFNASLRAIPVVDKNEEICGILSIFDIVNVLKDEKVFRETQAERIMSVAEVIEQSEDIGKARIIMREKNISRLPVVDEEGRLVGVVTVFDLLKAIKPKERMNWYSMAAEKLTLMQMPVSLVMNRHPLTALKSTPLSEIIEGMIKFKTRGAIIVEENSPIGVVTTKDLLEFYLASTEKKEGIYVQWIGLGEEDEFVLQTVDRIVEDTARKLHSIYPIQYMFLHVKKYRKSGERAKYSLRVRVMTDKGIFISKGFAWDLKDAVGEALDNLEKVVLRRKEKKETARQPKGIEHD